MYSTKHSRLLRCATRNIEREKDGDEATEALHGVLQDQQAENQAFLTAVNSVESESHEVIAALEGSSICSEKLVFFPFLYLFNMLKVP